MSRRFQFSLRAVLAAPVLVGVVTMAMAAEATTPERQRIAIAWVSMVLLIQFAIVLVLSVVGGRLPRCFGLGALFPAGAGCILVALKSELFRSPEEWPPRVEVFRSHLVSLLVATVVCGLAGMATAWVCSSLDQKK
jgi:hypothetical protein